MVKKGPRWLSAPMTSSSHHNSERDPSNRINDNRSRCICGTSYVVQMASSSSSIPCRSQRACWGAPNFQNMLYEQWTGNVSRSGGRPGTAQTAIPHWTTHYNTR